MIDPPFANYHHAELQRLVQEGFEAIESTAHRLNGAKQWGTPDGLPMDPFDFQVLMAAAFYLQTTLPTTPTPKE